MYETLSNEPTLNPELPITAELHKRGIFRRDRGLSSVVGPATQSVIDQIVEVERRAEEEALQKRIMELENLAVVEYQAKRYADTITHLTELLKLRPNHLNTQWLLKRSQEKLEIQKKEEAERKKREQLAREAEAKRQRKEAERKERERLAREAEVKRQREDTERRVWLEIERKSREKAAKLWNLQRLIAGTRNVVTISGIEYAFRWCPPGEFMMGVPSTYRIREVKVNRTFGEWFTGKSGVRTEQYITNSDYLQHRVVLTKGFWLMETQVTQAMWESVMDNNPSWFKSSMNPVEEVNWNECQVFCRKLSEKLGLQVVLPTEAQWEYACRAGTTGDYAGNLDEMGWYDFNSDSKTHAVGLMKPNAWGLYDMHGNVWEWCSDWYGCDYYSQSPTSDPTGPNSGSCRVYRGGNWNSDFEYCRSAYRNGLSPNVRYDRLGFRVALVPILED